VASRAQGWRRCGAGGGTQKQKAGVLPPFRGLVFFFGEVRGCRCASPPAVFRRRFAAWGERLAARPKSAEDGGCGDDGVEVAVGLDAWGETACIDEGGAEGEPFFEFQGIGLLFGFGDDFASDFAAALDFDDHGGAAGLQKEVDLASLSPGPRGLPPRGGGEDEGPVESEAREKLGDVVENQRFELDAEEGFPAGELFEGMETEGTRIDGLETGFDATEVETGVVVADAVADDAGGAGGGGVEAGVGGDEAGFDEFFEGAGQVSVGGFPALFRKFRGTAGTVGEGGEKGAPRGRGTAEHIAENPVQVVMEDAAGEEGHATDVFVGGKRGVEFFQIARDAAGDGEHVEDFVGGNAGCGFSPEFDAVGQREFAQNEVEGAASGEGRAMEDVVGNPRRDRSAQNQDELGVGLELHVPSRFEVAGEVRGGAAHPGNFVEEDDGSPGVADIGGEVVESFGPIAERGDGTAEKDGVAFGESFQLGGVRNARARRAAFESEETRTASLGEFSHERAFPDTAASPAGDERGDGFLPQFRQAGQFFFSSMKHRAAFPFPKSAAILQGWRENDKRKLG